MTDTVATDTEAARATEVAREATRQKLARAAAPLEQINVDLKAFAVRLQERDRAEKLRAVAWNDEFKALLKQRDTLRSRHKGASDALDTLRREFVPVDTRLALKAAERDLRGAEQRRTDALADEVGARAALADLRHRLATQPSGATAADSREALKIAAEAIVPTEARAAQSIEAHHAAEIVHSRALLSFTAAMTAARAL